MKIGEYFQQGDILIKRVSGLPKGEIIKAENVGYVLAEGETTGHKHKIEEVQFARMVKTVDGKVYLSVTKAVPLKHDEHYIIIIEPGEYEVSKVREKDHTTKLVREVQD